MLFWQPNLKTYLMNLTNDQRNLCASGGAVTDK